MCAIARCRKIRAVQQPTPLLSLLGLLEAKKLKLV
jgi:hypothetical protein